MDLCSPRAFPALLAPSLSTTLAPPAHRFTLTPRHRHRHRHCHMQQQVYQTHVHPPCTQVDHAHVHTLSYPIPCCMLQPPPHARRTRVHAGARCALRASRPSTHPALLLTPISAVNTSHYCCVHQCTACTRSCTQCFCPTPRCPKPHTPLPKINITAPEKGIHTQQPAIRLPPCLGCGAPDLLAAKPPHVSYNLRVCSSLRVRNPKTVEIPVARGLLI